MKQKTLSIAESCTGGLLGHRITQVPGSSRYFVGGLIAYSDDAKTRLLGISKTGLAKHGAVSAYTAGSMAKKVRQLFRTDLGVGITGIAGPGGGSRKKPVGLVYIAVSTPRRTRCERCRFKGSRSRIKSRAARQALKLLRREFGAPRTGSPGLRNRRRYRRS